MKITLIENFRALFYAPFYAALELGAYGAEGLDVDMVTPDAASKGIEMLTAGTAHVSWGGPLRVILAHDRDPGSDTVVFCEVVGRDPFFLIGREPHSSFQIADLVGQRVGITTEVPTPWICLQRDLQLAGIDPAAITRTPPRTMAENSEALRAGEVDVIQVFQPYARNVLDDGSGHLWYAAADRGLCCYTTLNTTRRFIREHPEVVQGMTRAIYRTQKWIYSHSGAQLAALVASYLSDIPADVLARSFDEYKSLGVWSRDPTVKRAGIEWKRDAMLETGTIKEPLEYEDYVDPRFGEAAVHDDPASI
jgi:NitT/TauT family transport system substrate-binding protein